VPAYWLARAHIVDPAEYKKYTDQLPPIFEKYEGKILARGARYEALEGPANFERYIVIEFPTFEKAVECFHSKEYSSAAAHRRGGAGVNELTIVDSGDMTEQQMSGLIGGKSD
jgi:uncharacterized protein (DUF1330 family)